MPRHARVTLLRLKKLTGLWLTWPIALNTTAALAQDQVPPPGGERASEVATAQQPSDAPSSAGAAPSDAAVVDAAPTNPVLAETTTTAEPTGSQPSAAANAGAAPQVQLVAPPPPDGTRDENSTGSGGNPPRRGVRSSFAVTGGYASPSGNMIKGIELSDVMSSAIPLGLDFRVLSQSGVALGLYLQFAPGFTGNGNDCDSCSTYGGRIGLEVGQHFAPTSLVDPWLTAGIGYEFVTMSEDAEVLAVTDAGTYALLDGTRSLTASSLPELILRVGLDFGTERLRVGPYAFASWGRYGKVTEEVTCDDSACANAEVLEVDSDIADSQRSSHYWLGGGIRVSLNR